MRSLLVLSKQLIMREEAKSYLANTYASLTKREVKMAGYWPSSFFLRFRLRSIKTQKKERGQYPAILTEQPRSIKDLFYGFTFKNYNNNKTKQDIKLLYSERNSS